MKVETTITIEADLLARADIAAKSFQNRSEVFEKALRVLLADPESEPQKRKLTRAEEIEVMNRYADEHHDEILETLSYQIEL